MGCFGPFPNINTPFSFTSPQAQISSPTCGSNPKSGGRKQKKRKRNKSVSKSDLEGSQIANSNLSPLVTIVLPHPPTSIIPESNSTLKQNLVPPSDMNSKDVSVTMPKPPYPPQKTSEAEETAAIGAEIGFHIAATDPILVESVGESGPQILSVKYPHLYDLEDRKRCSVSDRLLNREFVGHWKTQVVDHGINQSIVNLQAEMSVVVLSPGEDQWKCILYNSDTYSVCVMRRRIEQQRNSYITLHTFKWNKTSPIKVNCFIGRAMQMRIPSEVALRVRGVGPIPVTCGACIGGVECANHLLLNCPYACETRSKIFNWCGITDNYLTSVADLLTYVEQWGTCPKKRKRFRTICHSLLWNLWKYRNDRIFNGVFRNPTRGQKTLNRWCIFG
ncbi:unnamed protein product [Lactuca virosa]|uniref:Reverse transcriptase zinc-binding domain-containing protein n=1 Tax=Lactuca virosa TaxID=75947 RepID=A0AAU9PAS7_9ASTR|nr:unnamed protein product [Lactuca virosa]